MTTPARRVLRVATYNVQGRMWADDRCPASAAVEAVLGEIDADVVALQEAHPPSSLPTTWDANPPSQYHAVYGPTITKRSRPFGNVLLSRHPITRVRHVDLSREALERTDDRQQRLPRKWAARFLGSIERLEPRGALDVELEIDGVPVRVVATHLGLRAGARAAQVTRLLEHCGAQDSQCLTILLGDINEWSRGPALRTLHRYFGPTPAVRSFPSRWPIFALDRVWTRPTHALLGIGTHLTPRSLRASDHLPVVATVALGG